MTVLVHGLWMRGVVMELQRRYLTRMGFDVMCYSYPTMRCTLTENADRLAQFARALPAPGIHWVGHSMGGLVILRMLEHNPTLPPGRVVLIGTPYCDTYAGRALAGRALGQRALGRSMREWLEPRNPIVLPGRDIGVIAGSRSVGLGRLVARGLPSPNDGVVAVAETKLDSACDCIVLPVTHTSMLFSRSVARQTAAFLRNGRFEHAGDA
ncbi:MAG TPA: alpha/beta hydrolase [Burkholderiales bacterium]|jgi:pimeloyl-ACP methyl ester carboxylesterase|nr:alpha/beta hydrolase [Burkholderiales bacterium]